MLVVVDSNFGMLIKVVEQADDIHDPGNEQPTASNPNDLLLIRIAHEPSKSHIQLWLLHALLSLESILGLQLLLWRFDLLLTSVHEQDY